MYVSIFLGCALIQIPDAIYGIYCYIIKKISQTNLRKQKRSAKTITKQNNTIESNENRPGSERYRVTTLDELIKVVIENSEETKKQFKQIKKRMNSHERVCRIKKKLNSIA